jgi:phosphotransferase system HPr-like phosphotransfer protein
MLPKIEKPKLRKYNHQTKVDAVITLDRGFGTGRGIAKFVAEARKYSKSIFVRHEDNYELFDLKDTISAFSACLPKGKKLEIIVEGVDEEAERVALRIYSGITSHNSNEPYFDSFEQKEKGCPWAYSE